MEDSVSGPVGPGRVPQTEEWACRAPSGSQTRQRISGFQAGCQTGRLWSGTGAES